MTIESRLTFVPATGSEEITKPLGILLLKISVVVPTVSGLFKIVAAAASGVSPIRDVNVYRSAPLEIINVTESPVSTRPPPGGEDSMIVPAFISSLNCFFITTFVSPMGVSALRASS